MATAPIRRPNSRPAPIRRLPADPRRVTARPRVQPLLRWQGAPTAQEVRALLTRGVRVLPRLHPAYRAVHLAADLYSLYQQHTRASGERLQEGLAEMPTVGWVNDWNSGLAPGYFPNYPRMMGMTYNRVVTGYTVNTSWHWDSTSLYNEYYNVVSWRPHSATYNQWQTLSRWRRIGGDPAVRPSINPQGEPVTPVRIYPDPVPGWSPQPLARPGQELVTPTVPFRQIANWNRFRDWASAGQSFRNNGTNRRPAQWPAIELIVTPGQPTRILRSPSHRYQPPRRNEPERKSDLGRSFAPLADFIGEVGARRTVNALNAVTEANDWLNAIWFALPADVRNPRAILPHEKAIDLVINFQSLDLQQVVINIAIMEAQDRALAKLSQSAVRRLRAAPGSQQRGFEFFGSFI